MTALFLDTSLSNLVIGLVQDHKLLYSKSFQLHNELSIYTLPYLEEAFKNCNFKPNDIDTIMVINGPGSFTGIRIGVTIAKTYAWALNKKIIPVSSLKALALSASDYNYIIPIIDARSESFYSAIYDSDYNVIMEEQYINKFNLLNEIKKLNGNIKIVSDKDFNIENIEVNKINLDALKIVQYYENEKPINPHELVPNYLKKIEIEQNIK
jgi:tRNA threonylcarbamoyl adenosine modification protein YeaZ